MENISETFFLNLILAYVLRSSGATATEKKHVQQIICMDILGEISYNDIFGKFLPEQQRPFSEYNFDLCNVIKQARKPRSYASSKLCPLTHSLTH